MNVHSIKPFDKYIQTNCHIVKALFSCRIIRFNQIMRQNSIVLVFYNNIPTLCTYMMVYIVIMLMDVYSSSLLLLSFIYHNNINVCKRFLFMYRHVPDIFYTQSHTDKPLPSYDNLLTFLKLRNYIIIWCAQYNSRIHTINQRRYV